MGASACSVCHREKPSHSLLPPELELDEAQQQAELVASKWEERARDRDSELRDRARVEVEKARELIRADKRKSLTAVGKSDVMVAVLPEVASLGSRAKVAITGVASLAAEKFNAKKEKAILGMSCADHMSDDHGVAVSSVAGNVPSFIRPNQDDFFFVVTVDSYQIAGLFDGHGRDGHRLAAVVREKMLHHLLHHLPGDTKDAKHTDVLEVMAAGFVSVQKELVAWEEDDLDVSFSGVAASILVYNVKRKVIYSAWVGNVRCIVAEIQEIVEDLENVAVPDNVPGATPSSPPGSLPGSMKSGKAGRRKKTKKVMVPVALTTDHTTKSRLERARIEKKDVKLVLGSSGALDIFAPDEQWPGIPLTRCLGNLIAQHVGVQAVPEVGHRVMVKSPETRFAVMATDGIWDVMSEHDVLHLVDTAKRDNLQFGVDSVVMKAQDTWKRRPEQHGVVDDMSICAIWF